MKVKQVNKIIAEYMGTWNRKDADGYWLPNVDYVNSLDALVPVWRKLLEQNQVAVDLTQNCSGDFEVDFYNYDTQERLKEDYKSPKAQEIAAIATACAIKELLK